MITTNVPLNFAGILDLGYPGENNARSFAFDFSEWLQYFQTGGSVRLLVLRPGEVVSYPCVLTVSDATATWTVQLPDVEIPGNGAAELQYAVGDSVIKSKKFRTSIGASISASSGTVPEPHEAWVQEVLEAADRAEKAAEDCPVFSAKYGESTYEELLAEWTKGKTLVCVNGDYSMPMFAFQAGNYFSFKGATKDFVISYFCRPTGWDSKKEDLVPGAHSHAASDIKSGTLPITRGGTGRTTNPSMLVNLGSSSSAEVLQASPRPGVTGVLPISNGGTGASTAAAAREALGLVCTFDYDETFTISEEEAAVVSWIRNKDSQGEYLNLKEMVVDITVPAGGATGAQYLYVYYGDIRADGSSANFRCTEFQNSHASNVSHTRIMMLKNSFGLFEPVSYNWTDNGAYTGMRVSIPAARMGFGDFLLAANQTLHGVYFTVASAAPTAGTTVRIRGVKA